MKNFLRIAITKWLVNVYRPRKLNVLFFVKVRMRKEEKKRSIRFAIELNCPENNETLKTFRNPLYFTTILNKKLLHKNHT